MDNLNLFSDDFGGSVLESLNTLDADLAALGGNYNAPPTQATTFAQQQPYPGQQKLSEFNPSFPTQGEQPNITGQYTQPGFQNQFPQEAGSNQQWMGESMNGVMPRGPQQYGHIRPDQYQHMQTNPGPNQWSHASQLPPTPTTTYQLQQNQMFPSDRQFSGQQVNGISVANSMPQNIPPNFANAPNVRQSFPPFQDPINSQLYASRVTSSYGPTARLPFPGQVQYTTAQGNVYNLPQQVQAPQVQAQHQAQPQHQVEAPRQVRPPQVRPTQQVRPHQVRPHQVAAPHQLQAHQIQTPHQVQATHQVTVPQTQTHTQLLGQVSQQQIPFNVNPPIRSPIYPGGQSPMQVGQTNNGGMQYQQQSFTQTTAVPQISPRPQLSPRAHPSPSMSPAAIGSPKPLNSTRPPSSPHSRPSPSPHQLSSPRPSGMTTPSPRPHITPGSTPISSPKPSSPFGATTQSSLQHLEQMVVPHSNQTYGVVNNSSPGARGKSPIQGVRSPVPLQSVQSPIPYQTVRSPKPPSSPHTGKPRTMLQQMWQQQNQSVPSSISGPESVSGSSFSAADSMTLEIANSPVSSKEPELCKSGLTSERVPDAVKSELSPVQDLKPSEQSHDLEVPQSILTCDTPRASESSDTLLCTSKAVMLQDGLVTTMQQKGVPVVSNTTSTNVSSSYEGASSVSTNRSNILPSANMLPVSKEVETTVPAGANIPSTQRSDSLPLHSGLNSGNHSLNQGQFPSNEEHASPQEQSPIPNSSQVVEAMGQLPATPSPSQSPQSPFPVPGKFPPNEQFSTTKNPVSPAQPRTAFLSRVSPVLFQSQSPPVQEPQGFTPGFSIVSPADPDPNIGNECEETSPSAETVQQLVIAPSTQLKISDIQERLRTIQPAAQQQPTIAQQQPLQQQLNGPQFIMPPGPLIGGPPSIPQNDEPEEVPSPSKKGRKKRPEMPLGPNGLPLLPSGEPQIGPAPRPKKKREPKKDEEGNPIVKAPKLPKEKKVQKERKPKAPKMPKTPKEPKKARAGRKKPLPAPVLEDLGEESPVPNGEGASVLPVPSEPMYQITIGQPAPELAETTPPMKPKRVPKQRVRSVTPSRRKPSKTNILVNFQKKKKKKGSDDSDQSDPDVPPPNMGDLLDDEFSKRRSTRNTKRKKYVDTLDLSLSDGSDNDQTPKKSKSAVAVGLKNDLDEEPKQNLGYSNASDDETMTIQSFLATRKGKREVVEEFLEDDDDETKDQEGSGEKPESKKKKREVTRTIEVEEHLVKYKNLSYLHCEWKTKEELYKGDHRVLSKLNRYLQKLRNSSNFNDFQDEEPFNPEYLEVDRVLDCSESVDPESGKTVKHYLVKWRSLAYDEATWELEDEVDSAKIECFEKTSALPSKDKWKYKKRPKPSEWVKLKESPRYKNNNVLREYQLEGLNWLNFSYYNSRNCILADEMGLGKTIQSLAFLKSIYDYGIRGPFLVVAPLSTIPNWQREFEIWTDLNVIVYHGSTASRNMIQEYEMYYRDSKNNKMMELFKFHVLITTFEVVIADCLELRAIPFRICVIDEAHRLKNRNCKLLEGLRLLNLEHRVLLSGTPLQNNISELFSLLNFLEPEQFSSNELFLKDFGELQNEDQVQKLQSLLKPMMLRRLKNDVEKSLAPKEETIIEVELTNIQKKYYRAILERNFSFLAKGTSSANVPNLMNTMMELRKCCIHPYLLNGAEDQILEDWKNNKGEEPEAYYHAMINSCGKLVLIDKILPKLKSSGHRVLIFSQMVRCLDILEDYLVFKKYPFERIDGRIRGNLRQAAIDRYCKPDSDRFVFLLCTKAGGLGINLTAADTVIIYDSDWNPQNDLQAQARCHRIGQEKMVKVYRLITRNTYEREMFDKASKKLGLDKAVLQSMNTNQGGKDTQSPAQGQLGKKEIEDLLRKGAYGAIMDDENEGDKFCEEDIEQILQRRTQVITLAEEKSGFSKASFAHSDNRLDINIDDPDFWQKWARKAEIDIDDGDPSKELIQNEPRRRTQTRRFGNDNVCDMSDLGSSSENSDVESLGFRRVGSRSRRSRRRRYRYGEDADYEGEGEIPYGSWSRSDCFRVEKGLLTFGWGRWTDILQHSEFRKKWREADVEDCGRMILLYCISQYRGDEKIKGFVWDLISPHAQNKVARNHMGLSAPVPRGRKGKKKAREAKIVAQHMEGADWVKDDKYQADEILDQSYQRHVSRHANKVLLRVRMLYYIQSEIIGENAQLIHDGVPASELSIYPPPCDGPPASWWDSEADKCLLVGTFKHGYERYNPIRADPALCFLAKCGPPPLEDLMGESSTAPPTPKDGVDLDDDMDKEEREDSITSAPSSPSASSTDTSKRPTPAPTPTPVSSSDDSFPPTTELNSRLRKLISSYQRSYKREELRLQQRHRDADLQAYHAYFSANNLLESQRLARGDMEHLLRERDLLSQRRWSRREEQDFARTAYTFGVEYSRRERRYDWTRFRAIARLTTKHDDSLTDYLRAFLAMCRHQTGRPLSSGEEVLVGLVEPLLEDNARRTLERIELLSRVREEAILHPAFEERLKLAQQSSDLPSWWKSPKHDKDLLIGVGRHGLSRTDFYILNDPELSFREVLLRHYNGQPLGEKVKKESPVKKEQVVKEEKVETPEMHVKTEEIDAPKMEEPVKVETIVKTEDSEKTEEEVKSEVTTNEEGTKIEEECKTEETTMDTALVESQEKEEVPENLVKEKPAEESEEKPKDYTQVKEEKETKMDTSDPLDLSEPRKEEPVKVKEEPVKVKKEVKREWDTPKPPLMSLAQMEGAFARGISGSGLPANIYDTDVTEPTLAQLLAQTYQPPIPWPKDRILESRVDHLCRLIEKGKWPTPKEYRQEPAVSTSATTSPSYTSSQVRLKVMNELLSRRTRELEIHALGTSGGESSPLTPFSSMRGVGRGRRGRRRRMMEPELSPMGLANRSRGRGRGSRGPRGRRSRIDEEMDRAKLRALLSNTFGPGLAGLGALGGKFPGMAAAGLGFPSAAFSSLQRSQTDEDDRERSERKMSSSSGLASALERSLPVSLPSGVSVSLQPARSSSNSSCDNNPPPAHTPSPSPSPGPAPQRVNTRGTGPLGSLDLSLSRVSSLLPRVKSPGLDQAPIDLSRLTKSNERDGDNESNHSYSTKEDNETKSLDVDSESDTANATHSTSKLEDALSQMRKRKVDEGVGGVKQKRKKLDEIVLGLSAARGGSLASLFPSSKQRDPSAPILATPSVSIFAAPRPDKDKPRSESSVSRSDVKLPDFSRANITITPIPPPASTSSSSSSSTTPTCSSRDAKVNAWLSEQCISRSSDEPEAKRRGRPRSDSSSIDWNKFSGDEHVPVINKHTGKRLSGSKAPQLKNLAQWLLDNSGYNVDPQWGDLVKNRGSGSSGSADKRRTPSVGPPFSGLSALSPTSLFGGLQNQNPLLFPFAGLPSMGMTNPLFGNLAGFGIPGLPPMPDLTGSSHSKEKGKDKSAASSLPFLFPNPGLFSNPLTLGGLGGFPIPPFGGLGGASSLLNGLAATSAAATTTLTSSSSKHTSTSKTAQQSQQQQQQQQQQQHIPPPESDDESLKSLMGHHSDDLPSEEEGMPTGERVVIKESSKDLEQDLESKRDTSAPS